GCKKCEEIFAVNGVAKRAVDEAIEPAEKVRTGPRPVAATGRRRGEDGGSPMRSGARAPGKPVRRRGEDADDEAPEPAKKGAPAKPSGSKMPLLIGGAGLGVLVLVGGIVLAVVMLNKDDDKPATKPSGTSQTTSSNQSNTQSNGKQEAAVNPKKENKAANTDSSGFESIIEKVPHAESQKDNNPPVNGNGGSGLLLS